MLMSWCASMMCAEFIKAVNAILPDVMAVLEAEPDEAAVAKARKQLLLPPLLISPHFICRLQTLSSLNVCTLLRATMPWMLTGH